MSKHPYPPADGSAQNTVSDEFPVVGVTTLLYVS